jgi:hypothetical protein
MILGALDHAGGEQYLFEESSKNARTRSPS